MFNIIIGCFAGIVVFLSICFMIFYIHDADSKKDVVRIVITTIIADIVLIICAIVLMYIFSIIVLIIFILAAIWLASCY